MDFVDARNLLRPLAEKAMEHKVQQEILKTIKEHTAQHYLSGAIRTKRNRFRPILTGSVGAIAGICLVVGIFLGFRNAHFKNTAATSTSIPVNVIYMSNQLKMTSSHDGWLLTQHKVLHTTDSGRHWTDVGPKGVSLDKNTVYQFINNSHAVIATTTSLSGSSTLNPVVYITRDAGVSWTKHLISADGTGEVPLGLSLVDDQNGWVLLGRDGMHRSGVTSCELYRTYNGGQNWSEVQSSEGSMPFNPTGQWIAFVDENIGFTVAKTTSGTPGLYRTENGGVSWEPIEMMLATDDRSKAIDFFPPVFSGGNGILPIIIKGSQSTWHGLNIELYPISKNTRDLRVTHQSTGISISDDSDFQYGMADDHNGWFYIYGSLFKSQGGLESWKTVNSYDLKNRLTGFIDSRTGWMWDEKQKQITMTTNGGDTWETLR